MELLLLIAAISILTSNFVCKIHKHIYHFNN